MENIANDPMMFWGDVASLATALAWSLAVICFRVASEHWDSLTLNLYKNLLALFFFGLAFLIFNEPFLPKLSEQSWWLLALSGVVGITIGDVLFVAALRRLGASLQAIVDCLYAPIMIAMAVIYLKESLSWREMFGAFMILSSILVAFLKLPSTERFLPSGLRQEKGATLGLGLALGALAQFFMAAALFLVRDMLQVESVLTVTAFRFFFGTVALLPLWLRRYKRHGARPSPPPRPLTHWIWLVSGSFIGPFLATWLWLLGFKWTSASRAALFNQMATVFTVALAAIFLKEKLTPRKVIAVIMAVVGSLLL